MTENATQPKNEKSIFEMTTEEISERVRDAIKNAEPDPKTPPVTYLDPKTGKLITTK